MMRPHNLRYAPLLLGLALTTACSPPSDRIVQAGPGLSTHPDASGAVDDAQSWRALGGGLSAFFTAPGTARGDEVDPVLDDEVGALFDRATDRISLSLFEFDRQPVVDALLRAHLRGVDIEFVGDGDEEHDDGYEQLVAAGIDLSLRRPNDRIMHNKFVIVDDEFVWTGSTNFSENGVMLNNNGSLLLESTELAAVYRAEFDQMYVDQLFGRKKVGVDNDVQVALGGHNLQVHFSPRNDPLNAMLDTLDTADHTVFFMIFSFTHAQIFDKLVALHESGVQVVGIVDESQGRGRYSVDEKLAQAGVPVYIDGNKNAIGFAGGKLHHKSLIVDALSASNPTVTVGSYNWSNNATLYNDENLLVVQGAELTAAYAEEFCNILAVAEPHEEYLGELVDPCAALLSPLRINEWLANPDGRDSGREWVEVVNTGLSPLDITGYTLGDSSAPDRHVFGPLVLGPGDGRVVAESDLVVAPQRVFASSGRLSLGNSSDRLVLRDATGVVVDQTSWTGALSGVSFNREVDGSSTGHFVPHTDLSPDSASPGRYANGDFFGGTLVINEVLPNPSGTDSGQEYIEFLNSSDFPVDLTGWTLEDGLKVRHAFTDGHVVGPGAYLVIFDKGDHSDVADAINSSTGTLSLNNVDEVMGLFDADGVLRDLVAWDSTEDGVALVRATEGDAEAALIGHPDPFQTPGTNSLGGPYGGVLVINEVMPNPDGADGGKEWVELVNVGQRPALLGGWMLGDAVNPARHVFPGDAELAAGGSIVVFDGPDLLGTVSNGVVASTGSLSLNNAGDVVSLTTPDGNTHQALTYGVATSGVSFNRATDGAPDATAVKHSILGGSSSPGTRADGSSW